MPTDGEILKAFIEKGNIRPVRIYEAMNISKQAFYKLYTSKEFKPGTIDKIEKAIGKKWAEIKLTNVDVNVSRETPGAAESPTIQTIITLAASNQTLSDANKKLADAHYLLAEGNRELVRMVQERPTANVPEQSQQDVNAMRSVFLELLSQVGSGKRWKTPEEMKITYNKLVSAALDVTSPKGTQNNLDKRRT